MVSRAEVCRRQVERYKAALAEQETRRLSGLAFAPDEGKRSAYYALEILDELCKELRSET